MYTTYMTQINKGMYLIQNCICCTYKQMFTGTYIYMYVCT